MKEKRSFVVYYDWHYLISGLPKESVCDLFLAMFEYNQNGVVPKFDDPRIEGIFSFMKSTFDRDAEKYELRCKRNSENAKKRWGAASSADVAADDGDSEEPEAVAAATELSGDTQEADKENCRNEKYSFPPVRSLCEDFN